jgi:glycine C-acetyltransferase
MDAMRTILRDIRSAPGGADKTLLLLTDGVFSMDGDIAKLPEIVEAAEEANAIVYVDDAHGSGVLGRNGRGTVDHFGLHGRVQVQVGTLSKAIGVLGGYVAGSRSLRTVLEHKARPFLFSTSAPPAVAAACIAAVDVLETEPELIDRLWDNARFFKSGLAKLGFNIGHSETPITPVIAGAGALAMKLSDRLFEEGVFAQGIGFPTVPEDLSRVRTIVTAGHTRDELETCLAAFEKVGRELALI